MCVTHTCTCTYMYMYTHVHTCTSVCVILLGLSPLHFPGHSIHWLRRSRSPTAISTLGPAHSKTHTLPRPLSDRFTSSWSHVAWIPKQLCTAFYSTFLRSKSKTHRLWSKNGTWRVELWSHPWAVQATPDATRYSSCQLGQLPWRLLSTWSIFGELVSPVSLC